MSQAEFRFEQVVNVVISYKCPLKCRHCFFHSDRHKARKIEPELLDRFLDEIADVEGVRGISVTGGEPFSFMDELEQICTKAHERGLSVGVMTAANWASRPERAKQFLSRLVPGLGMLRLSVDTYHQEFVPMKFVENAFNACEELGLYATFKVVSCDPKEIEHYKQECKGIICRAYKVEDMGNLHDWVEIQALKPFGRALEACEESEYEFSDLAEDPCHQIMPNVLFDGRATGCCSPDLELPDEHPLRIGDLSQEPLSAIIERGKANAFHHFIRHKGPAALLDVLEEHTQTPAPERKQYVQKARCDVCLGVLSKADNVDILRQCFQESENWQKWGIKEPESD